MDNPVTYLLVIVAVSLLALLPAFYLAFRLSRKKQKQQELEAFNAALDEKKAKKKSLKVPQGSRRKR